jgi:carbon-monoxide dehydrogenase medium subunit
MLALGASVVARGADGERILPIDGFFTGIFETALKPGEIVTEIRIPTPGERAGGAYFKLERKVGDFATAAVAVQLSLAADGYVESAGIGLTNVGPMPILARRAAESLTGRKPGDDAIAEAARIASGESQPRSDRRGSADYKRDLVRVLTGRALRCALERAGATS